MNKFKIIITILIVFMFCISGIFKILYQNEMLRIFYLVVGLFELFLAAILLVFSGRSQMWAALVLVFAAWGGYSLYTTLFGLPCSCLGSAFFLPRGVPLGLNIVFFGSSWGILRSIGLNSKKLNFFSFISMVIGFFAAVIIYGF
jgi:hypothetical protein